MRLALMLLSVAPAQFWKLPNMTGLIVIGIFLIAALPIIIDEIKGN